MNYGKINKNDIANGLGVRVSLFVSGCTHRCKECFNPETWDFGYGEKYTAETEKTIIDAINNNNKYILINKHGLQKENIRS